MTPVSSTGDDDYAGQRRRRRWAAAAAARRRRPGTSNVAPPSTHTHAELNDNPRSLGSSQDRRGRTIGGISQRNWAPQNSLCGRERENTTFNCIFDVFKSINMPFYIKGGGGVQTPCLPHVGLNKGTTGGGGRPAMMVRGGHGPHRPTMVRPTMGPIRPICGLPPFSFIFN